VSRVVLVVLVVLCLYLWYRSRRGADKAFARSGGKSAIRPMGAAEETGPVEQSERSVELGLLPADRQDTRYAAPLPPGAEQALAAAREGDWRPAANLLEAAAERREWELRALYVEVLGDTDGPGDAAGGWLASWETERPGDAGAALVRARSAGPGEAARTALARAKELAPEDPTPYVVELGRAVAAERLPEDVAGLCREAAARAPHLYAAHAAALTYWLPKPKGRGSDPLADRFALEAADGAPLGSLMTAFPLIAWFEAHLDSSRDPREYRTRDITERVDRALMDAAAAPAEHPRLPELRHLLAYFLYKQERFEQALEQFRRVDGHVNALPWRYYTQRDLYMRAREATVRGAG
jgi:tetratricopeptide (TPR) repeat protein